MQTITVRNLAAVTVLLLFAPQVHAQQINIPYNFATIGPFGSVVPLLGQTFQAPAQYLQDFTVQMLDDGGGGSLLFTANIGTWTGTAVGSTIWSSGPTSGTSSSLLVPFTFNTGGLSLLTGGQPYIAYFLVTGGTGTEAFGEDATNPYAGGLLVMNFSTNPSSAWASVPSIDLAFVANFSSTPTEVVPEPATMTLLATGLSGLVWAGRRRRKA